ncbi:hypothetical protein SOPP22_08845 [Shewanella sp. OPT22]|nr:hypothetical protein SOPP22_08845 [Shewanella sp. OPT22]
MSIQQISMLPLEWTGKDFKELTHEQVRTISCAYQQFVHSEECNPNKPNAIEIPYKTSILKRTKKIIFTVRDASKSQRDFSLSFKKFNCFGSRTTTKSKSLEALFNSKTPGLGTISGRRNTTEVAHVTHLGSYQSESGSKAKSHIQKLARFFCFPMPAISCFVRANLVRIKPEQPLTW